MTTLGQIRTKIIAKIGDGTTINPTSAQVDDEINDTISYYEDKPFWFTEKKADITLASGNKYMPDVPDDYKQNIEPNVITVVVSNVIYTLRHVTPIEYDSIDVGGTGIPYYYTYRDGASNMLGGIQLYPYPDQDYEAHLYYRPYLATLEVDADENVMTQYAPLLIQYKALANLLRDYRSASERAAEYDGGKDENFNGGLAGRMLKVYLNETYNKSARGILTTENIINDTLHNY